MSDLTVYEKPTCTTCKKVNALLKDRGIDYKSINYYVEPISEEKLTTLVNKMNIPAKELFRKREAIYKELGLDGRSVADHEAITLMVKYPDLLQRPIVEKGSKAVLARPLEQIDTIL